MVQRIDMVGMVFGRLTVTEYAGDRRWRCICSCGGTVEVVRQSLVNGRTSSCGCYRREHTIRKSTTHGMTGTPVHWTWKSMMQRCYNKNNPSYPDYGGRGIVVCDEWHDFNKFYADMGPRPEGMTLDRVDVNGIYEPGNCRWASHKIQSRNKRNSLRIEGIELKYLAEELGMEYSTLYARLWRAKKRAEQEGTI
jgi:hypothetical protein